VPSGVVEWFDRGSGYGYVVPDGGGRHLYLHRTSIAGDLRLRLSMGDRVEFEARSGAIGPEAVNVVESDSERSSLQPIFGAAEG
jgi:CspA family cold shock protein